VGRRGRRAGRGCCRGRCWLVRLGGSGSAGSLAGDEVVPELTREKTMHSLKTRRILKQDRRQLGLPNHFYFLTPSKDFKLGEYLCGGTLGARAAGSGWRGDAGPALVG
jgi:hypothetical protein